MKNPHSSLFNGMFKLAIVTFLFNFIVWGSVVGVLGYVAYHFLMKVW